MKNLIRLSTCLLACAFGLVFSQTPTPAREPSGINKQRFEWFYRQRAYPFDTYPGTFRLKAIQDMERMMPRNGLMRPPIALPGVQSTLSSSQWTSIGPQPVGNSANQYSGRVNSSAVDPTNSNLVYIGTDGGGIWKTTDGGATWAPLTDTQPSLTITSIVLAPADPTIVYAGTGWGTEGDGAPSQDANGAGILKSTDGGVTWTQITGPFVTSDVLRIQSLDVQPGTSLVVVAAAGSHLYRTTDGGDTWTSVLSSNSMTQVFFDPSSANHAFAAGGKGVYQSWDGGQTWKCD